MFKGINTPIVTPFKGDNFEIDYDSLSNLIEFQISSGIDGITVCGTTGESSTLTETEWRDVVDFSIKQIKKRVPVVVGSGTNSTEKTISLTKTAKELGADGVLLVSPYYNKPTQEGLFQHFSKVSSSVGIPIILYDILGRTGIEIAKDTYRRLSSDKNVVGVKVSTISGEKLLDVKSVAASHWEVFAGDDSMTYFVLAGGGAGAISASANVIPRQMKDIVSLWNKGDFNSALLKQIELLPVINSFFVETNPTPVKFALKKLGIIKNDLVRMPLSPLQEESKKIVESNIANLN